MRKNLAWDITIVILIVVIILSIPFKISAKNTEIKKVERNFNILEIQQKRPDRLIELSRLADTPEEAIYLLEKAAETATKTEMNDEAAAIAYYNLARVYQQQKDYQRALAANRKGLSFAENARDSESLFRLFRQNGDIRLAKGEKKKAISVYEQAVRSLRFDRRSVPIENNIVLFKLKQEANLFLRKYITLLLESEQTEKALEVLSVYKLSEFQAFFNDPCFEFVVNESEEQLKAANGTIKEAIVYSFLTTERTYLIVQKQGLPPVIRRSEVGAERLNNLITTYRQQLQNLYLPGYKNTSILLYKLALEPIIADLKEIEKITFIQDEILRTIPMESLNDGKQYLIEKYIIDYASGLNRRTREIPGSEKILLVGSSQFSLPGFNELSGVKREIKFLAANLDGDKSVLLDRNFTNLKLNEYLKNSKYNLIHISTHGFFGGNARNSYLLAYDGKIDLKELTLLFDSTATPPNLLFLSGCDTAKGSIDAPLGISGTALKTGISNIVATLWEIRDPIGEAFVKEFYNYYSQGLSIAESKRLAQLELIRSGNAGLWSAFISFQI